MKKILALLLVLVLAVTFVSCGNGGTTDLENANDGTDVDISTDVSEEQNDSDVGNQDITKEQDAVNLAGLKGPTSMGLVKLLSDNEEGITNNKYNFTMAGNADEIAPKLIKGELDIAAVPANLASVLYNNTDGKVKVLAVNTLGVVYIVEKGGVVSELADLKGKTVYATGKGQTPEYTLKYILEANGINPETDLTIEFKSEPTEVVSLLQNDPTGVAMLPQPYVTVAGNSVEGLSTVINLNEEWDKLDNGSKLVTGVVVARSEFVENNPDTVKAFLEEYEASVDYVNTNTEEASALIEKYGIVKAPIAKKALPFCNITFIKGNEMKSAVSGYLSILEKQNAKAIGGKLPAEDFYYVNE